MFTLGEGRVGVLVNPSGECGPQLLTIQAWADEYAVELLDLGTSAEPRELAERCRLVIALGGDGTILRALHLAMASHAAVLGINFGHVGFLADARAEELGPALDRIARGEADVEERTALVATIDGEEPRRVVAFNDVVVTRRPGHGAAHLGVAVAGERMLALAGDGVVIASPTGSTAYTVQAGGPAVTPSLHAVVVTPLATQGSPLRSLVVGGPDAVRVEAEESSAPLELEVDGRVLAEAPARVALEVCAAPRKVRLVRTRPRPRPSTATWPRGSERRRQSGCVEWRVTIEETSWELGTRKRSPAAVSSSVPVASKAAIREGESRARKHDRGDEEEDRRRHADLCERGDGEDRQHGHPRDHVDGPGQVDLAREPSDPAAHRLRQHEPDEQEPECDEQARQEEDAGVH